MIGLFPFYFNAHSLTLTFDYPVYPLKLLKNANKSTSDTIGELKMILACQIGTKPEKIRLQKWNIVYKDHITLDDYEVKDGSGMELYYN